MLDLPRRVTFPRIVRRIVTGYGRVRPDSAPGCPERFDPEFLWFSWRWQANKRPRWLKTVEPYRDKAVQVTRDADVERLMTALAREDVNLSFVKVAVEYGRVGAAAR